MENYFYILIAIPLAWILMCLSYELFNLISIWVKSKLQDIKDKEYSLWD